MLRILSTICQSLLALPKSRVLSMNLRYFDGMYYDIVYGAASYPICDDVCALVLTETHQTIKYG